METASEDLARSSEPCRRVDLCDTPFCVVCGRPILGAGFRFHQSPHVLWKVAVEYELWETPPAAGDVIQVPPNWLHHAPAGEYVVAERTPRWHDNRDPTMMVHFRRYEFRNVAS